MRRAVPIAAVLAACGNGGGGGGGGGVEARLTEDVSKQLGAAVTVTCPPGKFPKACAVHVPGGADLSIDVVENAEAWQWSLRGFVIATAPLAAAIRDELTDLGVEATIDCGPALRATSIGERVRCDLSLDGVGGAAWAEILDEDGDFELELALTPSALAARSQDVDQAELERASRALDRDDAVGEGEFDDEPFSDAGVALDSPR